MDELNSCRDQRRNSNAETSKTAQHNLFLFHVKNVQSSLKVLAKKEKYKKQINGNTYREEIERREKETGTSWLTLSPSTALS